MNLSADDIVRILDLTPHPTCGLVKQTYRSKIIIPENVLPSYFKNDRIAGAVMYFMVSRSTQIRLHKIHSDQMYHFYFGAPVEILLLYSNKTAEIKLMGHDLMCGMRPQLFIPGGTFHMSRLQGEGEFSLLSTSEWIGVDPEDVVLADLHEIAHEYPAMENQIKDFVK